MTENQSPLAYATELKNGVKEKADKNKKLSDQLFFIIIVGAALSPILVLLPESIAGVWFNKIVPACLMACSAMGTSWCQLRKPHERWLLYRTAQREMEHEITQYTYKLGHYKDCDDRDAMLADRISKRALELHYQWEPIVPKIEDIKNLRTDSGNA